MQLHTNTITCQAITQQRASKQTYGYFNIENSLPLSNMEKCFDIFYLKNDNNNNNEKNMANCFDYA